ncbi:MAG: MarR family transcriptional regulator [Microbacteriaceae bacterium]|nr:MarR family transcriptional regulator [Microbacteriaceae bacterium]
MENGTNPSWRDASQRVGFLLSQVGAFASARFADRLAALGLQPSDVGILRLIAVESGLSQQALAGRLGVGPSRVVVLIDELERKGFVARERSTRDRRNYELRLTKSGQELMAQMREIGAAHENDVVGALSSDERQTLGGLLSKIAASHHLTPDVHQGYRTTER